jgi:asparagine synthase (glutamine-hydrolysing)
MCGIFALISNSFDNIDSYFVRGKKRGPEFSILKKYDTHYFGFHRLAINGLTPSGNQPLEYKHYVLICNGEKLNLDDIKKKYLTDKEINLLEENKIEILNSCEDDTLLDKIKIDDKDYYLSKSKIVYNINNEVIGVYKDGKIIM